MSGRTFGSPRRARMRARTVSAIVRGKVETHAAAEDEFGRFDCVRPTPFVELEAGAVGEQVKLMELIALLPHVGKSLIEQPRDVIATRPHRGKGASQVRLADKLDEAAPSRQRRRAIERCETAAGIT